MFWIVDRIEPVKCIFPDGTTKLTPNVAPRRTTARPSYINSATGFQPPLSPLEISNLLTRMSLHSAVSSEAEDELLVDVPCTRPDILHECDIMEDAAVAYGFNNITRTFPKANTVAKPLPINKLADLVRKECAMAGWVEVLPYILVRAYFPFFPSGVCVGDILAFVERRLCFDCDVMIETGSHPRTLLLLFFFFFLLLPFQFFFPSGLFSPFPLPFLSFLFFCSALTTRTLVGLTDRTPETSP